MRFPKSLGGTWEKMSSKNLLDIRKKAAKRSDAAKRPLPLQLGSKPMRLKTRRRRQRIFVFCICILCAAGIVGGLGAASHLEKFAIKSVLVNGAQALASDVLVAAATATLADHGFSLFSRKNMFLYPRAAIETTLAADFPRIKDVSVARQSLLAQAVVVTISEREPFALWCPSEIGKPSHGVGTIDTRCFVMDRDGFIYAPFEGEASLMGFATSSGSAIVSLYVFHGGLLPNTNIIGQTFLRGRLQGIIQLLNGLSKAGFDAKGISVDSEKDFEVMLENGPKLLASFEMAPSDIIRNLQTALDADSLKARFDTLQYIDLRFGNRVYYK